MKCHEGIWFEDSTPNCGCETCECCGEVCGPDEIHHFREWMVCEECLSVLSEEKERINGIDPYKAFKKSLDMIETILK